MELSKINMKLYGKCVTVGADAPVSIEGREKWLIKHKGATPAQARDTVHYLMAKAIYDAAWAWWHEEIPDEEDLVTWIDNHYNTILFEYLKDGDLS